MPDPTTVVVSVVVPARNEEACLADCLRTLAGQEVAEGKIEILVVDDHSTDRTRDIAESFAVHLIEAAALPPGWSGKCNACWAGARAAQGKWLLFTDADTRHSDDSIAQGIAEAEETGAALLSYSPRQEVRGFAERALMPVIFAELAATYRPKEVSDRNSPAAAANGQYLLVRRDAYDAVGGHASVAKAILEDVELARRVKQAGGRLQFRTSDAVSTRMYRSFPQLWEGWTKNLALLFPNARALALRRLFEFIAMGLSLALLSAVYFGKAFGRDLSIAFAAGIVFAVLLGLFFRRILRAHFDWLSNVLAPFGLPLFAVLLWNSSISHKRGTVRWKGRDYEV